MPQAFQTPFTIFPLTLPKQRHQSPINIYQMMFLYDPFLLLVIDIQKTYTIYRIQSQTSTTVQAEGEFQDQLADHFQEIVINGKSNLLYAVEDRLYLHDLAHNKMLDSVIFKERKFAHSSIYEEEFKFRLIPLLEKIPNIQSSTQNLPYVVLFWKTTALYKTNHRQLSVQLRVISLGFKSNQLTSNKVNNITSENLRKLTNQKLSIMKQYANISCEKFQQLNFHPHEYFPKHIKIQSQTFMNFTFGFGHPISYSVEGYHLQLSFLSASGQIKRKFAINSIFNQLVKEVIPVTNNKILILTKHESMNLEEVQRDQEDEIVHHQHNNMGQNNMEHNQPHENQLRMAESQLFKEDFYTNSKSLKTSPKQKLNHLFQFQASPQTHHTHFEQDERIDIYSIVIQGQNEDQTTQVENKTQSPSVNLSDLKLTKLYSSLSIKDISKLLSITPNVVGNLNSHIKTKKLSLLDGNDHDLKVCNDLNNLKSSLHQLYYQNLFTMTNSHLPTNQSTSLEQYAQLFKVTYSKASLYVKMLQQLWTMENQPNKQPSHKLASSQYLTENALKNLPQLNHNQSHHRNQRQTSQNPTIISSHTQNPFTEIILSLLID